MKDFEPIIELKIGLQRALIGEVTENLFAVTAGLQGEWIRIVAYFRGPVSEADVERIATVASEVIGDFPDGYKIEETALSLDDEDPKCLNFWAFKRAELK